MTSFKKRKSDGQAFPVSGKKGMSMSQRSGSVEPTGMKVISNISSHALKEISDDDYGSLYEIKGYTPEPEIEAVDKPIRSKLFVKTIDMFEATGDKQFENKRYVGHVELIPELKFIKKEKIKDALESMGLDEKEASNEDAIYYALSEYGIGIRMGKDKAGQNEEQLRKEVAHDAPVISGLIGFYMDQPQNRMGTTGWDLLNELVTGEDAFKKTLARYK